MSKSYPGFIDSHMHFLGLGYTQTLISLEQVRSLEELYQTLKDQAHSSFVTARGWNQELFVEKKYPSKDILDVLFPDIPVVLIRICGHVAVINSAMQLRMDLSGVTLDPKTDLERGVFVEEDLHWIYQNTPKPTKKDLKRYLHIANQICLRQGVTRVASDDFCIFDLPYTDILDAMLEAYDEGLIHVDITEQVHLATMESLQDFLSKGYANKTFRPRFRMGPLKLLADGSLGGRTAALLEVYSDDPGNRGVLTFSDDVIFSLIDLAATYQMPSAIHAIGDLATTQVLNAMEKSMALPNRAHGHAIIHAQMVNEQHMKQMVLHAIGAIVQPIFLNSDILMAQDRLGERAKHSYLFKTMSKSGITVGFSTDCPVETISPFENIAVAISRKSLKFPEVDRYPGEDPFTIDEALYHYTTGNLPFVGGISFGDEILLSHDLSDVHGDEWRQVRVLQTKIDGIVVYENRTL